MTPVITGADLRSSLGAGRQVNFEAFCRGATGRKPLQRFESDRFRFKYAYEIETPSTSGGDETGRATQWLCQSIQQVIDESQLSLSTGRIALLVGTGLRELRSLELWWTRDARFQVSDLHFAGAAHTTLGLPGPVFTFSNACAASSFALGVGADLLELGEADVVIVAGCDSITESMYGSLDRVTLDPPEAVRPFDTHRKGVLMGEGAAAVVLESQAHAEARGVRPLGLLRGVGINCDAYHETAPHVDGIVQAMAEAHARAGVTPAMIDLVIAHGTGTQLNDAAEARALQSCFKDVTSPVPITGLKGMTGHTSGAAGLMGVVTALEAMRQGRVPPMMEAIDPIAEAQGLNLVTGEECRAALSIAQINAFGFGGINAVVIVERGAAW